MKMCTLTQRKKFGGALRASMCGENGGGIERERERDDQQMLREDGSHYSLNAGILPPLGATARNTRRVKLRHCILSPFDPRYRLATLYIICFCFFGILISQHVKFVCLFVCL